MVIKVANQVFSAPKSKECHPNCTQL